MSPSFCMFLRALVLAFATCGSFGAGAHELRPAYLELRPAGPATWSVLWKLPAIGQALRLRVDARLPESCALFGGRSADFVGDAYVERWTVRCPSGLAGGVVRFEGLAALRTEVLLRIEGEPGRDVITARVTPIDPQFKVPAEPLLRDVFDTYTRLGVHHILLGADHLLFVLSLLLLVRGWRRLAATVTAFTIGHTLTLMAATLGGLQLPGPPVEAAIALSIAFAAAEALRVRGGARSLLVDAPWSAALFFGLLHGLGFASALREIGLPETALVGALLFFNLGVELGQLLFITVVLGLGSTVCWLAQSEDTSAEPSRLLAASHTAACYAIGVTAAVWLIERVHGFWS